MNPINRRQFVSRVTTAAAAAALSKFSLASGFSKNKNGIQEYVDVEISHGKIRGLRTEGANIFKGIPYAGRVSGDRRFRRPAPLEPWTGVRDALELGPPSIQSPPRRGEPAPAEDCLFLNVWTPANDNKKRPVMFYNHGGGYVTGSGGASIQDGTNLARNFDVVVVETNHRLGLLGYLYLDEIAGPEYAGSGNMGILDIAAGLKWVNENIAGFGGDPGNVMIWGESGGGAKTSCLYAMPEASPYFNKASIESGPGVRMLTRDMAARTTEIVFRELNIPTGNWRKILDVPAADILEVQGKIPPTPPSQEERENGAPESFAGRYGPVVGGAVLPNHPFDPVAPQISKDKPLMVGWNEDEITFMIWVGNNTEVVEIGFDELPSKLEPQFGDDTQKIIEAYRNARPDASAPDIYVAVTSINLMGLGSIDIAEKKAKQNGAPAYLYNFGYKSETKIPGTDYPVGTPHAMDITFKFNNEVPPEEGEEPRMGFGGNRPERFVASRKMAELWTTFARTGVPGAKDVPEWPPYDLETRATMRIDENCEVIYDRYGKELRMWRSIGRL